MCFAHIRFHLQCLGILLPELVMRTEGVTWVLKKELVAIIGIYEAESKFLKKSPKP